jgi:hypothetical protein
MTTSAIIGGFVMLLLQMLTEYVKGAPERKEQSHALVRRDVDVLDRALDDERMRAKGV